MGLEFIFMCFKLILALVVVLGIMILVFKLSETKINKINENKYIKVLDRAQISKDSSIVVVKIGEKGYIMATSSGGTQKLEEISKDEVSKIEYNKEKQRTELNDKYENIMKIIIDNLKRLKNKSVLKEEDYEEK